MSNLSWRSFAPGCCKNMDGVTPPTPSRIHVAPKLCSPWRLSINSTPPLSPEDLSLNLIDFNLHIFTVAELKAITRNFSTSNFIGKGGFGSVYKGFVHGRLRPGLKAQTVAVKRLDMEGLQGHKEWLAEVIFLGQLEHQHLMKLIGYCYEDEHRLLVYEFMEHGSLENHLFRGFHAALPWSTRLKIVIGAAKGLSFLHESQNPVIYRDFKASNILLNAFKSHIWYQSRTDLGSAGLAAAAPASGGRSRRAVQQRRRGRLEDAGVRAWRGGRSSSEKQERGAPTSSSGGGKDPPRWDEELKKVTAEHRVVNGDGGGRRRRRDGHRYHGSGRTRWVHPRTQLRVVGSDGRAWGLAAEPGAGADARQSGGADPPRDPLEMSGRRCGLETRLHASVRRQAGSGQQGQWMRLVGREQRHGGGLEAYEGYEEEGRTTGVSPQCPAMVLLLQ